MREALVFGGTGQIGRPLLDLLRRDGWRVTALSREVQGDEPGLRWLHGALGDSEPLPAAVDAVISCGPLDVFAHWYARAALDCPRVIAFGSTSLETKADSPDPDEQDVAARLRLAETRVFEHAAVRGAEATLLRPTLVYGAGRDATLSRIAMLAGRWGRFPLPRRATGLRQPVHVDDLAWAAAACLRHPATVGQAYALPGGETLAYREMIRRVLAVLSPSPRLIELPGPLFDFAVRAARASGRLGGISEAAVDRMRRDLVFDPSPAKADFGYSPRAFRPTPDMFPSDEP